MVSWREIASRRELRWRWRRSQVGGERETEEVGRLRGDKFIDGREGTRVKMVTTSHIPDGMPDEGAGEDIEHFELN